MDKKKKILIISLILIILLLLFVVLYLLFGIEKSFTITFDTNGGTEIQNIEVKNNEVVKLPEEPKKEGYTFVGWTNKDGDVITKGTKVTEDITLRAEWIGNDAEKILVKFNNDDDTEIGNITIEKGKIIMLPVEPVKEGYTFVGWINEEGKFITEDMTVNSNITLKAMWIKEDAEIRTISFNTDGGNNIGSIIVENGKVILLPVNPTKKGYVFAGWVDENGNAITKDTVVDKDITIKATWKEPYTCPKNCIPTGDGSKCKREVTTSMVNKTSCPSGYSLVNGQCLDVANKYHANSIDVSPWWSCNSSSEYMYSEIDKSGMGAFMWCAKKANKVTTKVCPSGYTKDGNNCKKTETVKCTAN